MKELSREEQLKKVRSRYAGRKDRGKSLILNELCETFGFHRKHAIRLMNAPEGLPGDPVIRLGPEPRYESIVPVVEKIWESAEQPCGKRLVEALPLWIPFYQKRCEALCA